jgi:hypothetical protein
LSAMSHISQIGPAVEDNGGLPAADSPDPLPPTPAPAAIGSSNKEPRGRLPSHRTIVDARCRSGRVCRYGCRGGSCRLRR